MIAFSMAMKLTKAKMLAKMFHTKVTASAAPYEIKTWLLKIYLMMPNKC